MISAHTPPGTEVVCINNRPGRFIPCPLKLGAVYTVLRIELGITGRPGVILSDCPPVVTYFPPWGLIEIGHSLARFRYLEIHSSLTDLLEGLPVRDFEKEKRREPC